MADTPAVKVRRIRPDDAGSIANFLAQATRGRLVVPYDQVVERLGNKAYVLAIMDQVVGLAGWHAENLVASIDDFVVHPASARAAAGRAIFESIEKEALKLECEVLLLFVPTTASYAAVTFYESFGFHRRLIDDVPVPWRQAIEEFNAENSFVMAKQLRELVVKPN
jgi:N-acetylglutamate synthase-like GNAT family acetyltransferase